MSKTSSKINPVDIISKLSWGESEDLEFKSARGGLPKSLWETYSAMANAQGGVILLGVKDDGTVVGIENIAKIKKDFWDTINNRSKVSINLLSNSDIQEVDHPQGNFLAIHVPQATRRKQPVYIGMNPLTGTYRRNAEGDYHCSEHEVKRMLMDQSEEATDSKILENFSLEDLDLATLHQYRQRLASRQPTHPWLDEDDKNLLKKLGGWRVCRQSGIEGLTLAGLLMFGREETIREGLPQYHVDYREKLSDATQTRWTDRLTLDGAWPGNLYQFYFRVIHKLATDLKLPFQLDNELVRKGETPVHEAIREALVNALIHADYHGVGGVIVEKYINRFEFSNPGSLLISFDQLLHGGVSECRNKALQKMFTLIGAAEKAGSGVDKIRAGWNSQHWRSPIIRESMQPDRVLWVLPMMSLIPKESLEKLKKQFGAKFSKFTPHEVQALVTADIEGFVDNARMRQITGCHPADITKLLQKLVSKDILVQNGQGRWTQYRLPPLSDSVHTLPHSIHKAPDSVHKGGQLEHKYEITDFEWVKLQEIAKQAKINKRLPPKQMEQIILRLCKDRWLTRNQISELVERNSDGIRARYLTLMVQHNLLKLRYPDKPNRTDQAYKSVSETIYTENKFIN